MARSVSTIERVITLAIADVRPPEIQRIHAREARRILAEHLARRGGTPPRVRTIVDGRIGASEESVRPYGVIRYEFDQLRDAVLFALAKLRELSPRLSGDYAKAWFLMHKGKKVSEEALPADATDVTICNDQPYSRMLLVGKGPGGRPFSLQNPPPGYMELAYRAVKKRYGNSVEVAIPYLYLNGGYRLKADYVHGDRYSARPDSRAGQPITYPALQLYLR